MTRRGPSRGFFDLWSLVYDNPWVQRVTYRPEHDAVLPRDAEGIHPLCAIYKREPVLAVARECLAADDLRMRAVLDRVDCDYLEGGDLAAVDPEGRALCNVNTPEELARVQPFLA